jgi:hypothetical protein
MIREELIKRSPFRILESSIHGGAGKGNIGVIAACKGIGKTACLVHLATDKLFQEKYVVHVSFSPNTNHIVSWYEDIFKEIAERYNLEGTMDVHDDIIRHRIILNFKQDGVSALQVQNSILSIINGAHFNADLIVIDGYDFFQSNSDEFALFKQLAEELNIEIWFTATVPRETGPVVSSEVPEVLLQYLNSISILIKLVSRDDYIHLNLLKDHDATLNSDLHLKLDPQILLIADEK